MSRSAASLVLILALLPHVGVLSAIAGAPFAEERSDTSDVQQRLSPEDETIPGEVIIRLRRHRALGKQARSIGVAAVDAKLAPLGVTRISAVLSPAIAGKRSLVTSAIEGIYRVSYSADVSPELLAETLSDDPAVLYAEPLYRHRLSAVPNDVSYGSMAQFQRVEAEAAWDVVKGSDGEIVIAIVDGGTDWNHPDLQQNVWTNLGEIPDNGLDDDENDYIDDVHGWNFAVDTNDPTGLPQHPKSSQHGTHVAGTAAAVTDNGEGVSSMSWNASFMPINAGSDLSDDNIAYGYDAITYAAANGADIISCSWGRPGGRSRFEQDVIDFAYENGALVIAAAGNESTNTDGNSYFPSNYKRVLSVGATRADSDQVAGFSNYGASVDVYAPGVQILSTTPNNGYSPFFSGTSMSTPMVAGLAALVKTLNPEFTVDELREQIRATSDPIEAENPGREGLLGRGRINARRAVSEFDHPSVRVLGTTVVESEPNGIISPGEIVDIQVQFVNYLASSPELTVSLSAGDPYATILMSEQAISSIASGATATAEFRFQVANNIPIHHEISFYTDVSGLGYSDRDLFYVLGNPSRSEDLDTGTVQTSVTTEGNIGALGFFGQTSGAGFVHDGNNYMFEGGLMIGTGVETVSDCIRGIDSIQDQDFRPAVGTDLLVSPGMFATQESTVVLVDSLATNPLGVTVLQKTYADSAPANQDFVIFQYTITNDNPESIENLHVGLFFDWDVNSNAIDYSEYDADRKMGIVYERAEDPIHIAATRLLTSTASVSYKTVDNVDELFDADDFSKQEKWEFLSGGIQTESLAGRDISQLTSEGPFTIATGESVQVAFAVIGAASLSELALSADQAQIFYDSLPTASEPVPEVELGATHLAAPYPNPFERSASISFSLRSTGPVEVAVFDVLGRRVTTLVDRVLPIGSHRVDWNTASFGSYRPAPGLYFIRMKTANAIRTRSIVLAR